MFTSLALKTAIRFHSFDGATYLGVYPRESEG